jgi:hypothetical protein
MAVYMIVETKKVMDEAKYSAYIKKINAIVVRGI